MVLFARTSMHLANEMPLSLRTREARGPLLQQKASPATPGLNPPQQKTSAYYRATACIGQSPTQQCHYNVRPSTLQYDARWVVILSLHCLYKNGRRPNLGLCPTSELPRACNDPKTDNCKTSSSCKTRGNL
jgi:hypothetical protein